MSESWRNRRNLSLREPEEELEGACSEPEAELDEEKPAFHDIVEADDINLLQACMWLPPTRAYRLLLIEDMSRWLFLFQTGETWSHHLQDWDGELVTKKEALRLCVIRAWVHYHRLTEDNWYWQTSCPWDLSPGDD